MAKNTLGRPVTNRNFTASINVEVTAATREWLEHHRRANGHRSIAEAVRAILDKEQGRERSKASSTRSDAKAAPAQIPATLSDSNA